MGDIETAWVGAMIDGEGTIQIYRDLPGRRGISVHVRVINTEVEIISTLLRLVGAGSVHYHRPSPNGLGHKDQWIWDIGRRAQARSLLQRIWPFLAAKRERAQEAMHLLGEPCHA